MINERFKNIREDSELTQNEVAEQLNISPQSVSKWERGEALPSAEYLPKLARIYGCKIDDFFAEEELESKVSKNIESNKIKEAFKILREAFNGDADKTELEEFSKQNQDVLKSILAVAKYAKNKSELSISKVQRTFNIGYCIAGDLVWGFEDLQIAIDCSKERVVSERKIDMPLLNKFISFLSLYVK